MADKSINWTEIKNWWPILMLTISVVLTFSALDKRLTVLETKLDTLIATENEVSKKYSDVETRYGSLAIRVNILETKIDIKK